jgi:hypothetical protein
MKCIGKKVILTPKKNITKKDFIKFSLNTILKNSSHQRQIPVKIPNTAPILRT